MAQFYCLTARLDLDLVQQLAQSQTHGPGQAQAGFARERFVFGQRRWGVGAGVRAFCVWGVRVCVCALLMCNFYLIMINMKCV